MVLANVETAIFRAELGLRPAHDRGTVKQTLIRSMRVALFRGLSFGSWLEDLPLRDAQGQVIGALGVVLFEQPQTNLQPLLAKFALLQRELDEARQALALQQRRSDGSRRAKHSLASFIGTSARAVQVKRQARRAAQSNSPVLLLGETGTGKELLAHAIHAASPRADKAFVSVNIEIGRAHV